MFDALRELGARAPIIAFPDGGADSYWHERDAGNWDAYIVSEVIPKVADEFGADPERVAIGGISRGGFGAYDIALHHPGRFCTIGGHSPALWQTAGETAPGAFDSGPFLGQPAWLDSGTADPFVPGIDAMASALHSAGADLQVHHAPGGHETAYWDRHWPQYFNFYAKALRHCN